MYETTREIDTRFKIFSFIHFQEFLILLLTSLFLYFRLKTINIWLKIPYFVICMSFVSYLMMSSKGNIGKKNIHSIFYSFYREKSTIRSIDSFDFSILEDLKYSKKRKKLKIKKNTLNYIDLLYITEKGYIKHKQEDYYIEILQIDTIDISNLTNNHTEKIINLNTEFYKKYTPDIKIISMNFPCDYKQQINYFSRKLDTVSNEFRKKFLNLKIQELEYLQSTKYNLEFYIILFIEGESNIEQDVERVKKEFPNKLIDISKEKKEKIFFKLNNMNTEV